MCNIFTQIITLCLPVALAGAMTGCLANPTPHPGADEGSSLYAPSLDESGAEQDVGYGTPDAVVEDSLDDLEDALCAPVDASPAGDATRGEVGRCDRADRDDP